MTVAAVVLAAGASTRMGRPKALIEWRGRPFFVHCVQRAEAAGCSPVVVVEGAVPLPESAGITRVRNDGWKAGPLSSLQVGLRAVLGPATTGVLVCTVDRPHVRPDTFEALLKAHAQDRSGVVQPRLGGKSGHPVLYSSEVAEALLDLAPTDTARTVLGRPAIRAVRRWVDVDDAAVLDNLDTPADLGRLPE